MHTENKEVAESKLRKLVREQEDELNGLATPKSLREAAQRPITAQLAEYVADLAAQGRSKKHVALARNRVLRLCEQCGWVKLGDVTSDSFNAWRASQTELGPKTCNEYLGLASAFLNWLKRNQRLAFNPLQDVAKAETKGKERRKRRALSQAEVDLLIERSGKHGLAYFLAAYTGLRRREIQQLMRSDLHLDAPRPFVEARPSTTKNKKTALIPLMPALAEALRVHLAQTSERTGKVFPLGVPTAATLRADLKACRIAVRDDLGRQVDFHALRHTFNSMLARAGIAPRVAMELMRHSDMRLTQTTYTDVTLLPLFNALEKLPSPSASLIASLKCGFSGPKEGKPVQTGSLSSGAEIVGSSSKIGDMW
ncbi:MAG: site-specific integrase [Opitutaceae bacterium]|nr:site-specific integrase [Opitutaceae bacterium]